MNSDSTYWTGSIGWLLVAGGVSLILIVAWCGIVFLLKITKRRLRFDSSKQTKEREKAHDSQSEQQAWLRPLIEQLENQSRRHNIDIFKDGNFDTYSFNKDDIAKVFLIEGNYKKLCQFLNRPVFKELEQDLEHFIGEKNREAKKKRERHSLLLKELELELGALVGSGGTNKEIIDAIVESRKYTSLSPNFKMWCENEIWYVSFADQKLSFSF